MKKLFYTLILGIMFSLFFVLPSSALSLTDIQNDPNYEVYTVTETYVMDIIMDTDNDSFQRDLSFDDYDVLYYDIQITNYAGMISIWYLGFYDYGGEDYGDYYSGDVIRVDQRCGGVRLELYADMPLDDVVIELRTCRYRPSAEFSSASTAYREGYDKGRADEAEIAKGQINDAYIQGGIDRSNEIAAHLRREISEYVDVVPDITPGFNSWVSFSSKYLAAIANQYETVEIPNAFKSGYDKGYKDGGDGAVLEGEPVGSYQLGYDRGYMIGKTEAFDSDAIVESIDKLAGNASVTLLQILNTKILDYSLMEFFVALLMVIVVIVGVKLIGSAL